MELAAFCTYTGLEGFADRLFSEPDPNYRLYVEAVLERHVGLLERAQAERALHG